MQKMFSVTKDSHLFKLNEAFNSFNVSQNGFIFCEKNLSVRAYIRSYDIDSITEATRLAQDRKKFICGKEANTQP